MIAMGFIESIESDMYDPCPKCGGDIKAETSGLSHSLERLYCEECGYEPEYLEALDAPDMLTSSRNANNEYVVYVCRECHEEVSSDVKRCPHCGWKPEKKGGLWWGITALMSLNPIGWIMGAEGASDSIGAAKGVAKKVDKSEVSDDGTEKDGSKTPTEKLKELDELKENDVITEEEFETKKEELLEQL